MPADREVVVVTGVSGAGLTTSARLLEDLGFAVTRNIPMAMMPTFERRVSAAVRPVVVADIRSLRSVDRSPVTMAPLRPHRVLFLDARDDVLVRRFADSRLPHPLRPELGLLDAIAAERRLLADAREIAYAVIDTSNLRPAQLRDRLAHVTGASAPATVAVLSFGFAQGAPGDTDLRVDLRFLANPYWEESLRPLDGRAEEVSSYVLGQPPAVDLVERLCAIVGQLVPAAAGADQRYLTIGVGCTGGRHRSVAVAEELGRRLRAMNLPVAVFHRDIDRSNPPA